MFGLQVFEYECFVVAFAVVIATVAFAVGLKPYNAAQKHEKTRNLAVMSGEYLSECYQLVDKGCWQEVYLEEFFGKSRDVQTCSRHWEILVGQANIETSNKRYLNLVFRLSTILLGMNDMKTVERTKVKSTVCALVMERTRFLFNSDSATSEDVLDLWEMWIDFLLVTTSRKCLPRLSHHFQALLKLTAGLCRLHEEKLQKRANTRQAHAASCVGELRVTIIRRYKALMEKKKWGKACLMFRIHFWLSSDEPQRRELGVFLKIRIFLALENISDRDFVADTFRHAKVILSGAHLSESEKSDCTSLLYDLLSARIRRVVPLPVSSLDWYFIQNLERVEVPFLARLEAVYLWNQFLQVWASSNPVKDILTAVPAVDRIHQREMEKAMRQRRVSLDT